MYRKGIGEMDDHKRLYENIKCRTVDFFTRRMGWMLVLTTILLAYVVFRDEIDWLTRFFIIVAGVLFIYGSFLLKKSAVYEIHLSIRNQWRFVPPEDQGPSWKSSINAIEKYLYQDLSKSKRYRMVTVLNTILIVLTAIGDFSL